MNKEEDLSKKMSEDWDERAQKNILHYISSSSHTIEEFFAIGEQRAQKIIDPLLEQWDEYSPDKTALEIGCGIGRMLRPLLKRFKRVYGVDVSQEMVSKGQELHNSPEFENITFHINDGMHFDFLADNTIDYVFSYEVFYAAPSEYVVEENIREVVRVLKPDGICQIHFKTPGGRGWDWLFGGKIPFPRRLKPYIPSVLKRLYLRDPLKRSNTWSGVAIIPKRMKLIFNKYNMDVTFQDDPTRSPGDSRLFAVGKKRNFSR